MRTKNRHILACILLAGIFFIGILPCNKPISTEPNSSLLINEIMYHPSENENTNEWIELYNPTSEPIDVNGWMIADEKETDSIQADTEHGDGTTIIPADSYAILTDKGSTIDDTFTISADAIRLTVNDSTLCGYGLNNQKEQLILMDSAGTIIDAVEWGQDYDDIPGIPANTVTEGNTLSRNTDTDNTSADFYESNSPTPGAKNSLNIPSDHSEHSESSDDNGCTSPSLLITELYYYTYSNLNNEFIRLCNPTNNPVDVSGWYLTDEPWKEPDDHPKIIFPDHTIMPANTSWYITKNASAFLWETATIPDFEYAVDSTPTVPQLPTFRTVAFSNDGGLVAVYNEKSMLIDLVIYGETNNYLSCWNGPSIPNGGQGVILKRNTIYGIPVDTNTAADWLHPRIYRIGQSDIAIQPITSTGEITTFVSPDNSYQTIATELRSAHHSIDINLYEFTNPFLYEELLNVLQRNITLRIFMEGSPIGGLDDREKYILSTLSDHGAFVRFIVSDTDQLVHARYQFDHAKYLIIDNETVIVESCNWAKTGIPKNPTYGNREWGVVIRNQQVAAQFSTVFQEDWDPRHADSYPLEAMNFTIAPGFSLDNDIPSGSYTPKFTAQTITSPSTITPLFSPDTSQQAIIDAINAATSTIYIQQLYIYRDWEDTLSPFLQQLINKSQQGVQVLVILDYNLKFTATIEKLNETRQLLETYNITVKFLSTEWSPFTTVHNKGMIIDNTTVLISSINWNEQSVRKNREAGVLIQNPEVATYYAAVFLSDWSLEEQKNNTPGFSWADLKYIILIAVVFIIVALFILRDWRKRKWN